MAAKFFAALLAFYNAQCLGPRSFTSADVVHNVCTAQLNAICDRDSPYFKTKMCKALR